MKNKLDGRPGNKNIRKHCDQNYTGLLIVRLKMVGCCVRWEVLGWFVTQCDSLSQHYSDSTVDSLV